MHSAYGFRSSARTLIVERLNVAPDAVEAQLAHMKSGPLGSAYDRAEFLQQRRDMMQEWADYCDSLRGDTASKMKVLGAVGRRELSDRRSLPLATVRGPSAL